MSTTPTTRNDVKQLAQQIEALAREVQKKLDTGADFLTTANELVRNNVTFTFVLGEVYALEQIGSKKKVRATAVSNPNYHNVRDVHGRFVSKV